MGFGRSPHSLHTTIFLLLPAFFSGFITINITIKQRLRLIMTFRLLDYTADQALSRSSARVTNRVFAAI